MTKSRCFRKADAEEQAKLEETLALLQDQDQEEAEPSTETKTPAKASKALVPIEGPPSPEKASLPAPAQPPKDTSIDPLAVFSAVMARPSMDDSPKVHAKTIRADAGPSTSSPQKFQGFLAGLVNMGAVDSGDQDILFQQTRKRKAKRMNL